MFTAPSWLEPRTAYVHVPFCGHHCGYCDFAVAAGQDHLVELYLDALELELRTLGTPRPVESLFVGGGTPTYLTAGQLDRLFSSLDRWLPRTGDRHEVSVESTPESWTAEKVRVLAAHGVNRASIGVQSFQPHLLAALDRRHGVEQIPHTVEIVRREIPALSFDLIFASPGQTLADWHADLATAMGYAPDHLSTYGLTYETGTPLWKARRKKTLTPVTEDDEAAMYGAAIDTLTGHGFEHYEVSNFARPGQRSLHNQRYWANDAYYGFGTGAARYVHGSRELNVRDTAVYIRRMLAGEDPTFQRETLAPRDRAFETMAVQLRRADGIAYADFTARTGFDLRELLAQQLPMHFRENLLTDNGVSLTLTPAGKFVADGVIEDLLKAA